MQRLRLPVVLLLTTLLLGGCAARSYQIHPGAVDEFDSRTYDVILSVQAGLDQAKVEFAAGQLPAGARTAINRAGQAYNTLVDVHKVYRTWKATGERPEGAEEATLEEVVAKIRRLIPQVQKLIEDIQMLFKPVALLIRPAAVSGDSRVCYTGRFQLRQSQLQWRVA